MLIQAVKGLKQHIIVSLKPMLQKGRNVCMLYSAYVSVGIKPLHTWYKSRPVPFVGVMLSRLRLAGVRVSMGEGNWSRGVPPALRDIMLLWYIVVRTKMKRA